MRYADAHAQTADAAFDGGSLDCGNGLLLLIRRHIDPLPRGGLLEIVSTESSVEEDLPSWCRLTGNELVSCVRRGDRRSFLVCKGTLAERTVGAAPPAPAVVGRATASREPSAAAFDSLAAPSAALPPPAPAAPPPPLATTGVGSWPRPGWLLRALHERLEGRSSEREFDEAADDAVRLAVEAQRRAGADLITDGEQRRDNYASFVGGRLENCQLVPISDLLPYVDDPDKFARELAALDVPARQVRHPAVFGPVRRRRDLAVHELEFLQRAGVKAAKIALPGPYLLARTMWLDCVVDKAYASREALAEDLVRALREELFALLAAGATIVQFDEPVLSEVVFGAPRRQRSFMCGALSERKSADEELAFARELLQAVTAGAPTERIALHICRGNWSRDERVALAGDYRPLVPLLRSLDFGTYLLELATPRAGELEALRELPSHARVGVGVVNQKLDEVESVETIEARGEAAVQMFGADRVLLNPDCGFATFADNPIASAEVAEAKLAAIASAAARLRKRHRVG